MAEHGDREVARQNEAEDELRLRRARRDLDAFGPPGSAAEFTLRVNRAGNEAWAAARNAGESYYWANKARTAAQHAEMAVLERERRERQTRGTDA